MKTKLTILAAMAAFSLFGQEPNSVPAKGASVKPTFTEKAPELPSTAKLWRLVARAQALQIQAEATDAAKAAKAAQEEVQAEQAKLSATCGQSFQLGYQSDAKAENAGDLVCVAKPKEQSAEVKK